MAVKIFLFCLGVVISTTRALVMTGRSYTQTLTVNNGGPWGTWRTINFCPEGYFAVGYKMKIEGNQFNGDDTGLNGVMLRCGDKHGNYYLQGVESGESGWGQWTTGDWIHCNTHPNQTTGFDYVVGFQLQVEPDKGSGQDDTAANYMRARCRVTASRHEYTIAGTPDQGWFGTFGQWSPSCAPNSAVCGIQDKLEDSQGNGDDTAINDVRLYCCSLS